LAASINNFEDNIMKKDDVIILFVKRLTVKGKRVYASKYGKKVFRLEIPREKYRA
jgi:hypothetical protein